MAAKKEMKLFTRVHIHLLVAVLAVLVGWAVVFYATIVDEITDEVDDSLEDYSELIIIRSLAGQELPSNHNGSNNQYYLNPISSDYALSKEAICYRDSMVYIQEKKETEPARILTTVFKNEQGQYFELNVYTPTIEKKDLLETLFYLMISLFASLLIAVVLINIWVFRRSMKPFYRLLDWLDKFRIGQECVDLDNPTHTTEFRKLNESVVRFAKHSQTIFEQQKLFIGNASHEIQTPLAVCQNRLEMLLMEDESLGESQMGEIIKTYQTLVYVSKLNKSLLLLSKIDNSQFHDMVDVSINDLLHRYVDDFSDVYAHQGLSIEFQDKGVFNHRMNDTLASVLITNLLKNAFVHNAENGRIYIETTSKSVRIANSGIKGLDESRIFERFYQGAKKEGSTGLGLAIVDSICKQNRLEITYRFADGMHWFELHG